MTNLWFIQEKTANHIGFGSCPTEFKGNVAKRK